MKRTKEEALVTRENLLSAGLRVFSRRGYSSTRLEDIAEEADVTRGAIYHHFGSKENLYKTLISERSEGINKLAENILGEDLSPSRKMKELLVRLLEYGEENAEYRALLELVLYKVEHVEGLSSLVKQTVDGRRSLAKFIEGLIREAIDAKVFRADIDPRVASYAFIAYLNGVGLIWIQDPESFSIAHDADQLAEALFQGLMA